MRSAPWSCLVWCLLPPLAAETTFGPVDTVYPDYLADQRRPRTEVAQTIALESDLEDEFDTGAGRFSLAVGERFRFLRWQGADGGAWQLDVDAAIFGQFDQRKSLDNIGWDGVYGARLSHRSSPVWAWKVAYLHLSAHLGDEFVLETGRDRIDYTRDELNAGVAWTPLPRWAFYGEFGYAFNRSSDRQEPLKLQLGAQRVEREPMLWGRCGWYLAGDATVFEEEDWDPALTLRAALLVPTANPGRGLELGLEGYHGRSPLGEFTPHEETTVTLFLAYDL